MSSIKLKLKNKIELRNLYYICIKKLSKEFLKEGQKTCNNWLQINFNVSL
jgi:hypothetical protein